MSTNKLRLFLFALLIMLSVEATAQNSLGDPVLNETFGVGSTYRPIGNELPFGVTNLQFVTDKCPSGSAQYTIASSTGGCLGDTWHVVSQDRTLPAVPGGYMMVINASDKPDIFYTQKVPKEKLCPGAKYQFAVNVLNILRDMPQTKGYDQPDITFIVEDASGRQLQAPISTGIIAATTGLNWVNRSVDFTAPADGSDVYVKLRNNTTGSMGNDLVLDDITVRPYGPVIDAGFGSITGDTVRLQCLKNGPQMYHLKTFVHNYTSPQYQWQVNINDKGWANINGQIKADLDLETEFLNPQPGKYQYRVGVLSAAGVSINCQTFSSPLIINVFNNPDFILPEITAVCEGQALSIQAGAGDTYYWTLPDGSHATDHFLNVTLSAKTSDQGDYEVTITDHGCTTTSKTRVVVYPPLHAAVDRTEYTICEGESRQLLATGGTTYKWEPAVSLDHDDIRNPIATPLVTTEYHVIIGNGGCEQQRTVSMTVLKKPLCNAGTNKSIKEGESVRLDGQITAGDDVSYYWTPPSSMDDATVLTPTVNPTESTTYTLHVVSNTNCGTATSDVFVRVFKKLVIPTTFTPNGDGTNDTWNIGKLVTYPESVLCVYTRSGQEVFRTVGDARQWNGTLNGKALPAGVYYYTIDLKNNLPQQVGWVMIIK
jgi:gliding motility-associated-like protein